MARLVTIIILPLVFIAIATAASTTTSSTSFIKTSCKATTYPFKCVQSLSPYSSTIKKSPRKLAQTALSVGLAQARSGKVFVTKLTKFKGLKAKEYKALDVCLDQMGESVDRLSQSIKEFNRISKNAKASAWKISNVKTWVSAALTDENTCLDAFASKYLNGKIKNSINTWVTNVVKVTSNALALVNKYSDTI